MWMTCLVHTPDWDSDLSALKKLFTRFEECGVALKPTKCVMGQSEVKFLGHVVSANKIAPDPKKVEAVRNWPTPTPIGDVRTFLGLTGYYRRYVKKRLDSGGSIDGLACWSQEIRLDT